MGNDCVKTSANSMGDDIRMTGPSRDTYKTIKAEKQRRQYYLNMNADAAEKSIRIEDSEIDPVDRKDIKKKNKKQKSNLQSQQEDFHSPKKLKDNEICQPNFDLATNKMVGYGHIQKHNIFHQVNREPEYKIQFKESISAAAKDHT